MAARVSHHELDEDDAELNLTPYLDVVLNLVVFLLLSFLTVSSFRLIDVDTPGLCADCTGAPRFELVLSLGPDGALISASDGSVSSEHLAGPLDARRLRDALASWKRRYQLDERITVSAAAELPYQQLVIALDAAREDGGQPLFTSPRLARAL